MSWSLIGNGRAVAAVQRSLAAERPPHAYLLLGPAGVGKATLAIQLAQALNCLETLVPGPAALPEPCGRCLPCTRIAAGLHADVQTVAVELAEDSPQRKEISVDQVRDVERCVALKPFEGRTRVVIVDPADAMSTQAQNAFLKTLEEPPPHVTFVLVAVSGGRLLPTVRSRCRRVEFKLVAAGDIEHALLASGVEAGRAALLSRLAGGRPGRALALAHDPAGLDRRQEALEHARSLPAMSLARRLDLAERLAAEYRSDRDSLSELLAEWQGWWRDVMLVRCGAEDAVANVDMRDQLKEDARRYGRGQIAAFVGAIEDTGEYLRLSVQARLALDALVMQAPSALLQT